MKILILSDSHSKSLDLDFSKFDHVIHCGDFGRSRMDLEEDNITYVSGNCDIYGDDDAKIELFGRKVFVTHGHWYSVKMTMSNLISKAKALDVEYVFYGHTHIQAYNHDSNIIFINPGTYADNEYCIITEDEINFYKNKSIVKTIENRW
jgi:putative phosphoesterase